MADVATTGEGTTREYDEYDLPVAIPPHNEGHTVASWFMMILITLAVLLGAVGLTISVDWLIIAGGVVLVCGLLGGWFLRSAGYGQIKR